MSETRTAERDVRAVWLGTMPYDEAHELQKALVTARIAGAIPDVLLLLEHPPVVTLGRGAKEGNVLRTEDELGALGASLHETGRGGDATVHNPGQLVAYPIFDLKPDRCDVRRYVRDLARVMIALAKDHNVEARLLAEYIGIWVNLDSPQAWNCEDPARPAHMAKLGAIGVRLSRWVTMHGFALNVANDLSLFGSIVPCGIREHGVTSLEKLGAATTPVELVPRAMELFGSVFDARISREDESFLRAGIARVSATQATGAHQ